MRSCDRAASYELQSLPRLVTWHRSRTLLAVLQRVLCVRRSFGRFGRDLTANLFHPQLLWHSSHLFPGSFLPLAALLHLKWDRHGLARDANSSADCQAARLLLLPSRRCFFPLAACAVSWEWFIWARAFCAVQESPLHCSPRPRCPLLLVLLFGCLATSPYRQAINPCDWSFDAHVQSLVLESETGL